MIEVTQKDLKGRIQTKGVYTEKEFGKAYRYDYDKIMSMFATEHTMVNSCEEPIEGYPGEYRRVAVFSLVAYNEKGKVLDPTYLFGLARNYYWDHRRYWGISTGAKVNWHRGCHHRAIHTTPERRAAFACEDQEEYTPKVRARRNVTNLPETWDDYWRFNQKNWKKFRKHQWKD